VFRRHRQLTCRQQHLRLTRRLELNLLNKMRTSMYVVLLITLVIRHQFTMFELGRLRVEITLFMILIYILFERVRLEVL
jgi:hypothetical protein